MSCPQILTGTEFVTRLVTHIDCQSRYLGSFGYDALGQPGSPAATAMTGLLTLFVAVWAFRFLFGTTPTGRDVIGDVLKVGIVLTLAFSWPAFRTVVHDLTLDGPAQIAASLSNPVLATTGAGFLERLQSIDNAILDLIDLGTGRWADQLIDGQTGNASFAGTALQDDAALGWARLTFLAGIVGSLGLLRIAAGLLLALAPLAAGMLLFEATRGLFAGWLRALVLTLIASVGVTIILAIELSILEPFLRDALSVRSGGYAAPSAPIELFAIAAGFTLVQFLMIWLLAKVAFMRGWPTPAIFNRTPGSQQVVAAVPREAVLPVQGRVDRIVKQMENRIRTEQNRMSSFSAEAAVPDGGRGGSGDNTRRVSERSDAGVRVPERLGSSYRRNAYPRTLSNRGRNA